MLPAIITVKRMHIAFKLCREWLTGLILLLVAIIFFYQFNLTHTQVQNRNVIANRPIITVQYMQTVGSCQCSCFSFSSFIIKFLQNNNLAAIINSRLYS